MGKWSTFIKKTAVLFLAAVLISVMLPKQAQAQEQSIEDDTNVSEEGEADPTGSESDTEKDTDDVQADDTDSIDEKEQDEIDTDDEPALDPMAVPILMDGTNELYSSLSQFLSLSSDQFQIYTVAIIDPITQQPVQPDSPVQVSLDVPSVYDTDRLVVSEISMSGETPARVEFPFTYNSGKAIFESDHSGIYVVMEKKVQVKLPASLDMTSKVEKLELTKKYYERVSSASSVESPILSPQTGDDDSVLIWSVVTAVAAAAVIVLVVIVIIKRRNWK